MRRKMYLNPMWDLLVNKIGGSTFCNKIRLKLYKAGGISIGKTLVRPGCFFYSNRVRIGNESFVNKDCFFYNVEEIIIGNNVFIAPQVSLGTNSHEIGNQVKRAGKMISSPITIENGSWIGMRTIILPRVNIGEGCIIAAGSVVTRNCEPNGLYVGVPAKRIKDLPESTS